MDFTRIRCSVDGGVASIVLNCPSTLNAIDLPMANELSSALEICESDPAAKVVVLSSTGRTFCGGCDLKLMNCSITDPSFSISPIEEKIGRITIQMKKLSKPIIAAVHGAAAGAGANLALASDIVFMSDDAKFLQAFVGIGLAPDTCGAYWLPRIIGSSRAFELFITGRPVSAEEAKSLGLALEHVPAADLMETVMSCARQLAVGPCIAYKVTKQLMFKSLYQGVEEYFEAELSMQFEASNSNDFAEGVHAFLEKRKPDFKGN